MAKKMAKSQVKNVDQFQVEWNNTNFILSFTDHFGVGKFFSFPEEDIETIRDKLGEALEKYRRGETSD